MTVTSVPCQVVRSTTQVYFNIRIDQKRRRAIHFCEQCRYYGRYCDAIHKGREQRERSLSLFYGPPLGETDYIERTRDETKHLFAYMQAFVDLYRLRWHAYRYHRKFPNRTSILFSKNVIPPSKSSSTSKNKSDRSSPIPRPYGP